MVGGGGTTYNTIGYNNSATHKQTGIYQNSYQADFYGNYKDDLITNQWLGLWDGSYGTITNLTTNPTSHGQSNLQIAAGGRMVTTGGNEIYNVGSGVNPVYAVRTSSTSNAVKLAASTSTVGSNTAGAQVPVYLNAGTITAMSTTTGDQNTPVYIKNGVITPVKGKTLSAMQLKGNGSNQNVRQAGNSGEFNKVT